MKKLLTLFSIIMLLALTGILSPTYGQWLKHEIDTEINWAVLLYAADIDDDGDLDLAAAGEKSSSVFWYENIGGTPISWTKYTIGSLGGAIGVYVADIDGDDDLDVAATGLSVDDVVWYENMGGTPISWTNHIIDGSLDGAAELDVADIDGDDTLDVVVTGLYADDVVWYKNMGGTPISWNKDTIDSNLNGAGTIDVYDLDKDGDMDVVATGNYANDVVWYENMGGTPVSWAKYTIDGNLGLAFAVRVADIDGDDTLDVIATGQNADDVIWYENNHPIWTPHPIDENLNGARCLYISDIDVDGDLDVVVTGFLADDVVWYENIGGMPISWTKHTIDGNLDAANDVITADIDGDDRQDVIATGLYANKVVWYNNKPNVAQAKSVQSNPRFIPTQGDTLIINAQLYNPENHPATVYAIIGEEGQAFTDSIQLYDDGQHGDSSASDNIWGNSKWIAGLPEDIYTIGLSTYDITEEYPYHLPPTPSFTTIGPITIVDFEVTSTDTVPNPGDEIKVKLNLKNEGQNATALNIKTPREVMSLDTSTTIKSNVTPLYRDIAPGETSAGSRSYTITFSDVSEPDKDYFFVVDILSDEVHWWTDTFSVYLEDTVSGIKDINENLPVAFSLQQNYPNPFNPSTVINYELPITNYVELSIYNLLGQKIASLVSEKQKAGYHQVEWDASRFSSGVYYYRIEAGDFQDVKKMILLR